MRSIYWAIAFTVSMFPSITSAQGLWEPNGPYGGWINDLTEDNSGRLLAATTFGGIYRSADDAESWQQIYNGNLIFDPTSVATNSSGHIFIGSEGVGGVAFLRSTNDGTTWEQLPNALSSTIVVDLLPTDPDEIFACTFDDGLYRSTDNGTTFSSVSSLPASFTSDIEVNSSGDLFVGTQFDGTYMYRSIDNGTTWQPINSGITSGITDLFITTVGEIYGTDGLRIYKSTTNGDSWTNLLAPPSSYTGVVATSNGDIYAAGGGIWKSTDDGTTWTEDTGVPTVPVKDVHISTGGTIFAGTLGPGVYRRLGALNWQPKVSGMYNTIIDGVINGPTG